MILWIVRNESQRCIVSLHYVFILNGFSIFVTNITLVRITDFIAGVQTNRMNIELPKKKCLKSPGAWIPKWWQKVNKKRYQPQRRERARGRAARRCRGRGAARRRAPRARCTSGTRAALAAAAPQPCRGTRARSAPSHGTPESASRRRNARCNECSASNLYSCCSPETEPAFSPPGSFPSSTNRPPPGPQRASLLWTALPAACLSTSSFQSTQHCPNTNTTSNRPANAFRGVAVAEFQISTRFTLHFRHFSGPGLVAGLARKHNTRAGPRLGQRRILSR